MPYGSEQDNGMLHLYDLQIHDSGVYICQARNNDTQKVFEDKVSITVSGRLNYTLFSLINPDSLAKYEQFSINFLTICLSIKDTPRKC